MTDDENLRARQEILAAYVTVLEDAPKLFAVCAATRGGGDEPRAAVAHAFGISDIAAHAVLDLQVRRFTPEQLARVRAELADAERRLAAVDRAGRADEPGP